MMTTDKPDIDLVRSAQQGERTAFDELVRRYRSAVFGIAYSKLGDFEAARDAAQDTFVHAFLDLQTLRDPQKFGSWLCSITVTAALGAIRRRRNYFSLDDPNAQDQPSGEPSPQEAAERSENACRVHQALAGLPENYRLPIILHYVDGYSHDEIANILTSSVSSVKNRLYRARHHLRKEMLVEVERSLKDERCSNAKDICVIIQWFGKQCSCRCRHCLLNSGSRLSGVSFDRMKALGKKFLRWRDAHSFDDLAIDIITGYSCDSSEDIEGRLFCKAAGATNWSYLPTNGMELRTKTELEQYLLARKEMGITTVGITFYGMKDFHDKWAGRSGDWDYTMLIAKTAAELGLKRQETIFLSKKGVDGIPSLVELLDQIAGMTGRCICPWDYRGRGKHLEDERVLDVQVKALPENVLRYINQGINNRGRCYLSEGEWVSAIEAGKYPRKDRRVYLISVWPDNIEWLESADCDSILQKMRDEDEQLHTAIPSLPTLARLYGKKSGKRIYWVRDLEWKWIDLYLKEHPQIDPTGRFDDLDCVILCH
ncbi:sigma-70 family RNA polymerase sigma factor [bacterium]|nr:sigma-70 family RNA polymerase sigma factor [bacterium]